jgi:hypothetical protein
VAHAFGHRQPVRQVFVCERGLGVEPGESLEHGAIDEQRHRERIALLGQQELLVTIARRRDTREPRAIGQQELAHIRRDLEVVDLGQRVLQRDERGV